MELYLAICLISLVTLLYLTIHFWMGLKHWVDAYDRHHRKQRFYNSMMSLRIYISMILAGFISLIVYWYSQDIEMGGLVGLFGTPVMALLSWLFLKLGEIVRQNWERRHFL